MRDTGRAMLYDTGGINGDKGEITNWPGTLRFNVLWRKTGRHNWGLTRHDVWFIGPEGQAWWGVRYGDNTQIVHCKRIKSHG